MSSSNKNDLASNEKRKKNLVCPLCKGKLEFQPDKIICLVCDKEFEIKDSIPILINKTKILDEKLIKQIKIKSDDEVSKKINESRSIEKGCFSNKTIILLIGLAFFLSFISHLYPLFIFFVFFIDYGAFVVRRLIKLKKYNANRVRIESSGDYDVINDIYEKAQIKQPTMCEWEKVYGLSKSKIQWKTDLHYNFIKDFYQKNQSSINTIVEIGTNDGRICYKYGVGRNKDFYGIDVSLDLLQEFSKNCGKSKYGILADGCNLPIATSSADFVICSEVLEHLAYPDKAFKEFERILKPGGYIAIQSPNAARIRNLNPLHILSCVIGLLLPFILLPKIVHENTWYTASTYHYDFSRQQISRFIKDSKLKIEDMFGAFYTFNPDGNKLNKLLHYLFRYTPILNQLGGDLCLILRKAN